MGSIKISALSLSGSGCAPGRLGSCKIPVGGSRLRSLHTGGYINYKNQLVHRRRLVQSTAVAQDIQQQGLPKNFDPLESEQKLYDWWEKNGYFSPNEAATGEPFTISMPPPNVTGKLHMGHAMFVTLQDIMARFQRMRGRPTFWVPGTDHAGIATQMVVERMLTEKGMTRQSMGRDAFEQEVWKWKEQYGGYITQQLRRLGASCDWTKERFTLDEGLCDAVVEAFVQLHGKGLIYKGSYLVNWAPGLQTAVSDLEVEYSEENGVLYYFKYPVDGSDEYLPIATTRPETILGDTAVAVHPDDARYSHLVGKKARVPLSGGRTIPIIADTYVDMEFGTGALKITPGHDVNDYELGKRHSLEIINIMNNDGTLNAAAGAYESMDRFQARKLIWEDLKKADMGIKEEQHVQRVPRSQRGGEIVEPLVREQWFIKMEGLAKPALQAVENGDTKIVPERFEKTYRMWLEDIRDWCISRQLWWGHRIPVWYVFDSEQEIEESGSVVSDRYVVARNDAEALETAKSLYGPDVVLRQEEDVLDTWFSSSLWPFSTLGWPDATSKDLMKYYPTSVMETGHDILFFWVARMMMMGIEFTGVAPFHTIYLHGLVRDEKGRKMSKSLGNVVDPVETIEQYGADSLRYTLATGTSPGQDLNLSLDRVNGSRNFTNKIWNISKFVLFSLDQKQITPGTDSWSKLSSVSLPLDEIPSLSLPERWIISRLHETVDQSTRAHDNFDFGDAGRLLYDFIWSDLADWYVEISKSRLYGDNEQASETTMKVLVYVLQNTLKLAHPFMPFITEELWQAIPNNSEALIAAEWPIEGLCVDADSVESFESFQAAIRAVRNARAEYEVEPGKKIAATVVTSSSSLCKYFNEEIESLALLAKLDKDQLSVIQGNVRAEDKIDAQQIELVVKEGLEVILPLSGLFDPTKEIERLEKQASKITKELEGLTNRLSNKNFVDKAPKHVVDEVQAAAKELSDQLTAINEKIENFKNMS